MDSAVAVNIYQGSLPEKEAMSALCEEWNPAEFWPFEEFLVSLRIPGTFLLYQAEGKHWLSLALGRVSGSDGELFFIFVSARARRRGLAELLLIEFCEHARRNWSCERIILEVRASNEPAQKLYEKQGFEKMALRKRYYQNGEDALVYEKNMNSGPV